MVRGTVRTWTGGVRRFVPDGSGVLIALDFAEEVAGEAKSTSSGDKAKRITTWPLT